MPRGQDLRPEVAGRLEQDPAQALPGRAPDHRRRQRALGARRAGRSASCSATRSTAIRSAPAPRATRSTSRRSARSPSGTARSCWSRRRRSAALSRIETAYAESDQRQYWVPCPSCGAQQVLVWSQVRWDSAGGEHRPETARYHCVACDAAWSDALRWAAIRRGEWRAAGAVQGIAGFHLNEIYSSWVRLEAMVRAFLSARAGGGRGDEDLRQHLARRDLDGDAARRRTGGGSTTGGSAGRPARCRRAGCS